MNKILFITKLLVISLGSLLLMPNMAKAHVNTAMEKWYVAPKVLLSNNLLENRLESLAQEVDVKLTKETWRKINEYIRDYRSSSERLLGRSMLYFPIFEKEINKRNLPEELKYVTVIESLLRTEATSKSGAAGMWQLLRSTGRMLGLTVNNVIDERRDPVKSTKAALDYLEQMYDQFGDWTLAIAAYNCGPGSMRKAIRRGGSKDFWKIKSHLPTETQDYIPRFIAASYLMNYYHLHDLNPDTPSKDMRFTTAVEVNQTIDLGKVESQLEIEKGLLYKLNPSFRQGYVPASEVAVDLYIPLAKFSSFLKVYQPDMYDTITEVKRKKEEEHKEAYTYKNSFIPRDSIKSLERLVYKFITCINPLEKRRRYNIPVSMRSNLSYHKA